MHFGRVPFNRYALQKRSNSYALRSLPPFIPLSHLHLVCSKGWTGHFIDNFPSTVWVTVYVNYFYSRPMIQRTILRCWRNWSTCISQISVSKFWYRHYATIFKLLNCYVVLLAFITPLSPNICVRLKIRTTIAKCNALLKARISTQIT